jgi:TetR/AcrR family transcriptional regulator
MGTSRRPTRERILDSALDRFGTRGFEAVSLDEIATDVGVAKQTVLYWFPSKDELLTELVDRSADELAVVVEAALRHAPPGFGHVEAVVRAVFRPAVRRPALLGLVRELGRLGPVVSGRLMARFDPLIERAIVFIQAEMDAGRMRRADPRLVLSLAYATVVGVATEPEALRAVGWEPSVTGLRRLRSELLAYLRAALSP